MCESEWSMGVRLPKIQNNRFAPTRDFAAWNTSVVLLCLNLEQSGENGGREESSRGEKQPKTEERNLYVIFCVFAFVATFVFYHSAASLAHLTTPLMRGCHHSRLNLMPNEFLQVDGYYPDPTKLRSGVTVKIRRTATRFCQYPGMSSLLIVMLFEYKCFALLSLSCCNVCCYGI